MTEITVDVPIGDSNMEYDHVDALKRAGVPLRNYELFLGVEAGVLSWEDLDGARRYKWSNSSHLDEAEKTGWFKRLFARKYRIRREENLASVWYVVEEWNFYWPLWSRWTHMCAPDAICETRFNSIYEARRAIQFRKNPDRPPVSTVVEHL